MKAHFKQYQYDISIASTDNEKVFRACEYGLNMNSIQLMLKSSGRHERRAERAIRTIKERFRTVLYGLPYQLPRRLYPSLLAHIVGSINMTPNSRTLPASPRELLAGVKTDMKTAFRARFGDFVLARVPNADSGLDPRAEYGIIVGRDVQTKGSVKVYIMSKNEIVHRNKFVVVHPTDDLVKTINALCKAEPAPAKDDEIFWTDDDKELTVKDVFDKAAEVDREARIQPLEVPTTATMLPTPPMIPLLLPLLPLLMLYYLLLLLLLLLNLR